MFDSEEANQQRLSVKGTPECDAFVRLNNPYVIVYKLLAEVEKDENQRAQMMNKDIPRVSALFSEEIVILIKVKGDTMQPLLMRSLWFSESKIESKRVVPLNEIFESIPEIQHNH